MSDVTRAATTRRGVLAGLAMAVVAVVSGVWARAVRRSPDGPRAPKGFRRVRPFDPDAPRGPGDWAG
jgi:hypothetical protein